LQKWIQIVLRLKKAVKVEGEDDLVELLVEEDLEGEVGVNGLLR